MIVRLINILIGPGIMLLALFFSFFIASGYTSNAVQRILMDVIAVV
jgi:hypothetical protein